MINIFNKLNIFLSKRQKQGFFILTILMSISALLEIIGIGIVPIFISAVLDYEILNKFLIKLDLTFLSFITKINQKDLLIYISIFVMSLFLFKNLFLLFIHYLQNYFSYKVTTSISSKIYKKYLFNDYSFHLNRNSATLIKNISQEINISVSFLSSFIHLFREIIIFVLICILLLKSSPLSFTFISVIFLTLLVILYQLLKKKVTVSGEKFYKSRERLVLNIQQSLGFIKEVIVLNKRSLFFKIFKDNLHTTEYQSVFLNVINKIPRLVFEVLAVLICLLIVNFFYQDSTDQLLPILTLYGISLVRLIPSYSQITSAILNIKFFRISFDMICNELEIIEPKLIEEKTHASNKNLIYKKNKIISVDSLSFSYEEKKNVLKDINLNFMTGQAIGIIGSSGSGKTTLGDLLMGLYEPEKGLITYDNKNINKYLSEWRSMIGYVPQDVFILDTNLRNNITVEFDEKSIDHEKLDSAIKMSNCEEYINKLPNKLDTKVGERGIKLSGGQRQRIGIARALYKNPDIILFDEATSNLDSMNEQDIIKSIVGLKNFKTLICISHKLSNLKNMDKIVVFKDGMIEKIGSSNDVISYLEKNNSTGSQY